MLHHIFFLFTYPSLGYKSKKNLYYNNKENNNNNTCIYLLFVYLTCVNPSSKSLFIFYWDKECFFTKARGYSISSYLFSTIIALIIIMLIIIFIGLLKSLISFTLIF